MNPVPNGPSAACSYLTKHLEQYQNEEGSEQQKEWEKRLS